jgi:hypothetical protein
MASIIDKQYSLQLFYNTFVCYIQGALWNIYNTSTALLEKSRLFRL